MFRVTLSSSSRARLFSRAFSTSPLKTLIVADHNGQQLASDTACAVSAAVEVSSSGSIGVLIAGHGDGLAKVAASAAKLKGVSSVLIADHPLLQHKLPEAVAPLVAKLSKTVSASYIVASSNSASKSIFPRLAALLDQPVVSEVLEIRSPTAFQRPTYAGNALVDLEIPAPSDSAPALITVRPTSFDPAPAADAEAAVSNVDNVESLIPADQVPTWIRDDIAKSDRPELSSARIVVSGGRGMKSSENFGMLYELADVLGGAVGASRAAVDAGYVGNDLQVGQTGKVVAPDLYIAVGISGAIQHLAGMKDSKVIVAINKDPDAPIFQVSDYGLVADLFKVVPEFKTALEKSK